MLVESNVQSPKPVWRERIDRQFKPDAKAPIASINRPNDDVDPPPAPAVRTWPRVFPGL